MTLENSIIVEKTVDVAYSLIFEYEHMDKVMRIIKEKNLRVSSQKMELNCVFGILVRKRDAIQIKELFENLRCLVIK